MARRASHFNISARTTSRDACFTLNFPHTSYMPLLEGRNPSPFPNNDSQRSTHRTRRDTPLFICLFIVAAFYDECISKVKIQWNIEGNVGLG